jgi:hypothetical protein
MTAPSVASQTRVSSGPLQRSHIAQHDKATIESIQTSATAGAMAGIAASKKQPTFEQLSLANISLSIVRAVSLDHRRLSQQAH